MSGKTEKRESELMDYRKVRGGGKNTVKLLKSLCAVLCAVIAVLIATVGVLIHSNIKCKTMYEEALSEQLEMQEKINGLSAAVSEDTRQ